MMKRWMVSFVLNALMGCSLLAQPQPVSTTWFLDRTDSIGGYTTTALPKLPAMIETSWGKAALFSCFDSTAFLVNCNPIGSDTSFTVEVYFRPDSTVLTGTNNEQRFLHIRNLSNDNRRILLELRQLQNQRWLLDTYIKSESSNLTLVDSSTSHSSGEWHHVALTYKNRMMRQFVDRKELLSGPVTYLPIDANGKTSIGARQDPRSWFNGAIRMVKITHDALTPGEFTIPSTTEVARDSEVPLNCLLSQNFPNPFNPCTNFQYRLEREALVSIKIYSLLGNEVATLVHGVKPAGTYDVQWNASTLSSGVYFCKMQSGFSTSTRKLLLAK